MVRPKRDNPDNTSQGNNKEHVIAEGELTSNNGVDIGNTGTPDPANIPQTDPSEIRFGNEDELANDVLSEEVQMAKRPFLHNLLYFIFIFAIVFGILLAGRQLWLAVFDDEAEVNQVTTTTVEEDEPTEIVIVQPEETTPEEDLVQTGAEDYLPLLIVAIVALSGMSYRIYRRQRTGF